MAVFLNMLFVVVSVFYMTGRLYEISVITDLETGLFTGGGIVTTPLMMLIICIMAVCCGVIMFISEKQGKKIRQMPVGILGIMAGVFFIAGGIVNSVNCFRFGGFILYHGMEAIGGIGLVLLGIMNIRGESKEKVPVVLTLLIPVGVCMNSILHEIKTIRDTEYLMRSLAGIFTLIFLVMLFRTAYAPGKTSRMLLYISGLINFVFTGLGSLAAVMGGIITGTVSFPQLLYNIGFAFIGLYSVFMAFFISPSKIEYSEDDTSKSANPVQRKVKKAKRTEPEETNEPEEYNFTQTGSINQDAIAQLFALKDLKEMQDTAMHDDMSDETKTAEVSLPAEEENNTEDWHTFADIRTEFAEEKTAEIYVTEKNVKKAEAVNRSIAAAGKKKSVFKGSGRKSDTKKIVYKAPK